jgi:hypothetical protein
MKSSTQKRSLCVFEFHNKHPTETMDDQPLTEILKALIEDKQPEPGWIHQLGKNPSDRGKLSASRIGRAAALTSKVDRLGLKEVASIADELRGQLQQIRAGDLRTIEEALFGQSLMLDAVASKFLEKALDLSIGAAHPEQVETVEKLMRIALKCQNQSRKSLTALADIRHPKRFTVIKRQQNLLVQNQPLHLEGSDNDALDIGETRKAAAANPAMETLDTQHGTQDTGG